jgi:CRP/FNR family transcriptional regulator
MLKFDGARHAETRRQCDHCLVRRGGLCGAFAEGGGLPLADLEAAHLSVRVLEAGDIIYLQGDSAAHVYNVVSGWIQLHQDMADGRRCISQFVLPGETFGVTPHGARHARSASATTAASICAIPIERMNDLRRLHPTFNEHFIGMLENDYLSVTEALTMTAQGTSLERVARILWGLAARLSKTGAIQVGAVLKAPLTQRHIADATGLTAIHVNRVVRRLREQALVDFHDGVMVIEDPHRLATLANEGSIPGARWLNPELANERSIPDGERYSAKRLPGAPDQRLEIRNGRAIVRLP